MRKVILSAAALLLMGSVAAAGLDDVLRSQKSLINDEQAQKDKQNAFRDSKNQFDRKL